MPLEKKWYGVTEFAFEDPDGYVITFAERTPIKTKQKIRRSGGILSKEFLLIS